MNIKKFGEIIKSDEIKNKGKELMENSIGALSADPVAYSKLSLLILDLPLSLREQYFWNKFDKFIKGVYLSLDETVELSDKLFGTEQNRDKNAKRIIEAIGKIEAEESLQFIINATRSVLLGLISLTDYFRIIKAIEETLLEDLIFLSENITLERTFKGNTQILSLARSGMMIVAGIDANESVEEQEYAITSFGRMVDQYALSFGNEERLEWHKNNSLKVKNFDTGLEEISNEDINNLF